MLYFIGRGGPGLINFLALALYSRLLTADQYGQYALILAGLGLVQAVGFQWLGLSLARFLPSNRQVPHRFMSETRFLLSVLSLAFCISGLVISLLWPDPLWKRLIAIAVVLLVLQAWYEFSLIYAMSSLRPKLYGQVNLCKSSVALATGSGLAWLGFEAYSPLLGLLLGMLVSHIIFSHELWGRVEWGRAEDKDIKLLLAYGFPLAINFALTWVVASSDRFLLTWLENVSEAGKYAVGYDLAQQSIGLILSIVNLAAYPLAIHALERGGITEAREQLKKNGEVIFTVAICASAVLSILAPEVVNLFLGVEYRSGALEILPLVALATALAGIKSYHFDIAFHLGRATKWLITISVLAAVTNVLLNLVLIPKFGILGAAYSTVLTYLASLLASIWMGRKFFVLPAVLPLLLPAVFISTCSALGAFIGIRCGGWQGLVLGLIFSVVGAMLCALSINFANIRNVIWRSAKI